MSAVAQPQPPSASRSSRIPSASGRSWSAGTTKVTETFDYSTAKLPFMIELLGMQKQNAKGIESTLTSLVDRYVKH